MTTKRFSLALAIALLALLANVHAQTPRMATVNITPDADKVRISTIGDAYEMRVDVMDEQGEVVFQSGAISGQQLDWNMRDSAGERVAAGSYLVTVTYRNASGKLKKLVEQVTVDEAEKSDKQPTAAPQAVQAAITGAGATGKIAKFTGAATIGNSVITESAGKIGINVAAPVSKLHILSATSDKAPRLQATGTTSFAAGWDFYHGTVGKGYVGVPGTGVGQPGPGEMLLYGGTGVKTSLWAGGVRGITIATNGNVGIGTTTPDTEIRLHVISSGNEAVRGEGTSDGVVGISTSTGTGAAIFGRNHHGGFAGLFHGKVAVVGALNVGSCTGCSPPSDRNLKANFSAVNSRLILDRLSTLPIQSWNYKSEDTTTRHIGPMAQDFRAAFNLGKDDKTLNTVDAQGVTMAAIQGLYQMMQEKDRQIETLTRKVEQQQAQLNQVKRTIKRKRAPRR